jgi:glutamyl-tRNA synthetase
MSYERAQPRLAELNADLGQTFWDAVRQNLARFNEAAAWAQIVRGPVQPVIEDAAFAQLAADLLPETLDWKAWTDAVKAVTGAKGRALFMPLRRALTGMDHGPELAPLLPLIGREKLLRRLAGDAA